MKVLKLLYKVGIWYLCISTHSPFSPPAPSSAPAVLWPVLRPSPLADRVSSSRVAVSK